MIKYILGAILAMSLWGGVSVVEAQTVTHNTALTWNDNSDNENGFYMESSTGANAVNGPFTRLATLGINVTQFIHVRSGLPGALRCYRIQAFNAAGNSTYSNVVCDAIPPSVPMSSAPSNLVKVPHA